MLQTQTVKPALLEFLKELMELPDLSKFNLVGGTALALQLGHRFSEDIDLFCYKNFDQLHLQKALNDLYAPEFTVTNYYFIQFTHRQIKVDLLDYPYSPVYEPLVIEGVRMLQLKDIVPMKLAAISNRGAKKDFYDLYYLFRKFSLSEMLELYKIRFQQAEITNVIRSVQYFEDAEKDKDPICFEKLSWKEVKAEINKQVKDYLLNY